MPSPLWCLRCRHRRKARAVPLKNAALQILIEMGAEVESAHLITHHGKLIKDFRSRWEGLLVRAKIKRPKPGPDDDFPPPPREENFHFHDRRTEFASEMLRNNVNPEIVRRLFAHSTMQITQGYMQTDDMLLEAVNRLDDVQSSEVVQ